MDRQHPEMGGGKRIPAKETDRLQVRTRESRRRPTEAEDRVMQAVAKVHFTDERDAAAYRQDLDELRGMPDEIRRVVTELELAASDDHNFRWTLFYVLADLEMPELAPMLVDAAVRELPEITEATACESVEEEEILASTMAVEALERLARKEPEQVGALFEVVERQPNVAVRAAAVQAILSTHPDREAEIRRLLPEDQLFMLETRRVSVEQLSALPEEATPKRAVRRNPKLPSDTDTPRPKEGGE